MLQDFPVKASLTIAHCLVRKGKAHVTFFAPDPVPVIHDCENGCYDGDTCDTMMIDMMPVMRET